MQKYKLTRSDTNINQLDRAVRFCIFAFLDAYAPRFWDMYQLQVECARSIQRSQEDSFFLLSPKDIVVDDFVRCE